jgi:putative acetyltransferase
MNLRIIQKFDNNKIAKVIRDVFISDDFPKTGTAFADKQLDFLYEFYQQDKAAYFVLDNQGDLFGGCGIAPLEEGNFEICELQKMYILQEVRGKGYAKLLIECCIEKAKELGFKQCYIETLPEMKSAQKLYLSYEFAYIDSPLGNTGHSSCPIWMLKNL